VRFGGEVYDCISLFRKRPEDIVSMRDIASNELVAAFVEALEVVEISSISKRIQVDYLT